MFFCDCHHLWGDHGSIGCMVCPCKAARQQEANCKHQKCGEGRRTAVHDGRTPLRCYLEAGK